MAPRGAPAARRSRVRRSAQLAWRCALVLAALAALCLWLQRAPTEPRLDASAAAAAADVAPRAHARWAAHTNQDARAHQGAGERAPSKHKSSFAAEVLSRAHTPVIASGYTQREEFKAIIETGPAGRRRAKERQGDALSSRRAARPLLPPPQAEAIQRVADRATTPVRGEHAQGPISAAALAASTAVPERAALAAVAGVSTSGQHQRVGVGGTLRSKVALARLAAMGAKLDHGNRPGASGGASLATTFPAPTPQQQQQQQQLGQQPPAQPRRRCPHRRFLAVVGTYGRLNNNLKTFEQACYVADELHRTLLLPRIDADAAEFGDLFDLEELRARYCLSDALPSDLASALVNVTASEWEFNSSLARADMRVAAKRLPREPDGLALLQGQPDAQSAPVLAVRADDLFHFERFKFDRHFDRAEAFYGKLKPSKGVRAIMARAMQAIGLEIGSDYVGVHLRTLEGSCSDRAGLNAKEACELGYRTVVEATAQLLPALALRGAMLFAATDGQDPERQAALAEAHAASGGGAMATLGDVDARWAPLAGDLQAAAADLFLLARARIFFGTYVSSFSQTVAHIRRATGAGPSVLRWPGECAWVDPPPGECLPHSPPPPPAYPPPPSPPPPRFAWNQW